MTERVAVIWDDALAAYDFGPGHPLTPLRVQFAMRLATEFGLLDKENVDILAPVAPALMDDLGRVHSMGYIGSVIRASDGQPDYSRGLGSSDCPIFPDMHNASARVAGATLMAAKAVYEGGYDHAVNLAGGLHHAMPDGASGFCIYSDIGVAIAWLLEQGVERIAYLDVDVHHGDGVQKIFWDDPRVLTISIHQDPRTLFPNVSGFATEIGDAKGSAVNVALPPGTGDQGWLRAFNAIVPDVLEEFAPQIILSQHGCDTHFLDPLASLQVSMDGLRVTYQAIHQLVHRYAGGRWIAVGGGGYDQVDVVPRAWTHLIGEAVGSPVDPNAVLPANYRDYVLHRVGPVTYETMSDGRDPWISSFDSGFNPEDEIDRAILATRRAVYPAMGIPFNE